MNERSSACQSRGDKRGTGVGDRESTGRGQRAASRDRAVTQTDNPHCLGNVGDVEHSPAHRHRSPCKCIGAAGQQRSIGHQDSSGNTVATGKQCRPSSGLRQSSRSGERGTQGSRGQLISGSIQSAVAGNAVAEREDSDRVRIAAKIQRSSVHGHRRSRGENIVSAKLQRTGSHESPAGVTVAT